MRVARAARAPHGGSGTARVGVPPRRRLRAPSAKGRRAQAPTGRRRRGARAGFVRAPARTRPGHRRTLRTVSRARARSRSPRGRAARARRRDSRARRAGASSRSRFADHLQRCRRTSQLELVRTSSSELISLARPTRRSVCRATFLLRPRIDQVLGTAKIRVRDQGGRLMSAGQRTAKLGSCPVTCSTTATSRTSAAPSSPLFEDTGARFATSRRLRRAAQADTRSGGQSRRRMKQTRSRSCRRTSPSAPPPPQ